MKSALGIMTLLQGTYWKVARYPVGIVHSGHCAQPSPIFNLPRRNKVPELLEPYSDVNQLFSTLYVTAWQRGEVFHIPEFQTLTTENQGGERGAPPGKRNSGSGIQPDRKQAGLDSNPGRSWI